MWYLLLKCETNEGVFLQISKRDCSIMYINLDVKILESLLFIFRNINILIESLLYK